MQIDEFTQQGLKLSTTDGVFGSDLNAFCIDLLQLVLIYRK